MSTEKKYPTDLSIITTYRCQMKCQMCGIWQNPSDTENEIKPSDLEMLPSGFNFINITGGEPFLREDLEDIINVIKPKTKRIVISTSGYHFDKITELAKKHPDLGFRVSIEGLSQKNDELRGRDGGFDRGLKTLLSLKKIGVKDIGFGITVSNHNSEDMLWLYELGKSMGLEFATAAFHNSFYFHKFDNKITNLAEVSKNFREVAERLMRENNPKSWFRSLFNLGLIRYINGEKRMLPCEAGLLNFFVDPFGEVYPCNGLEEGVWKESMGNIKETKNFDEIWFSPKADEIRCKVKTCPKNCWMVGTASPVMHKYIKNILPWIAKNKLKSTLRIPIDKKPPFFNV